MEIAIIKYNAGNVRSVENALKRLGITPTLSDNPEIIAKADKVLFPGQGEASNAMRYLKEHKLDDAIKTLRQPVLGICIGQQLLCKHTEEGDTDALGIFDAEVKRFRPKLHEDKVPSMGWNALHGISSDIFKGVEDGEYVYFVHSYYVPLCESTIATANHITTYSAALQKGNFYATQFHPEKSGAIGEKILKNFLEL